MISYAQNFEDVVLNRAFGGRAAGFYIDAHFDFLVFAINCSDLELSRDHDVGGQAERWESGR
jgi:hypothetical protein